MSSCVRSTRKPTGVMSNGPYNLTEGEQAIVLSGDLEVIQAALDLPHSRELSGPISDRDRRHVHPGAPAST